MGLYRNLGNSPLAHFRKARKRIAQREGILLNPLYDGKMFYTLEQRFLRKKNLQETFLFWNTGRDFRPLLSEMERSLLFFLVLTVFILSLF